MKLKTKIINSETIQDCDSEFSDLELDDSTMMTFQTEYDQFSAQSTVSNNLEFWAHNFNKFPQLYNIHLRLRVMSPTSCGIESAFSIAALSEGTKNRRNRLTALNLEKEAIIKYNKRFL